MITVSRMVRALWATVKGKSPGFFTAVHSQLRKNDGMELIEYIVMAGLLCAAIVVTMTFFGGSIQKMFAAIAHSITGDAGQADQAVQEARADAAQANTTGEQRQQEWGQKNN